MEMTRPPAGAGSGSGGPARERGEGKSSLSGLTAGRSLLQAVAVAWASKGWKVFPLRPHDKRPLTKRGFHDASSDVAVVGRWWRRWPQANIGLPGGQKRTRPDGTVVHHFVLDIDCPQVAGALAQDRALLQQLWAARTPAKQGLHLHLYARQPVGIVELVDDKGAHLGEVRGQGGYVVLPPSRLPEGSYVWLSGPGFDPIVVDDALRWATELLAQFGVQARPEAGQQGQAVDLSQPIAVGRRDVTLFQTFRSLVARGMAPEEAAHTVRLLNQTHTEEPLPAQELERQLAKWSRYTYPDGQSPSEKARRNGHDPAASLEDARRLIIIGDTATYDLARTVDEAWEALCAWNRPSRLFRLDNGALAEVREDGAISP